ncbi:MAG: putative bifunctional diguanylate cyclase/phosphodiesterase [Gaiellaceae bacterium]
MPGRPHRAPSTDPPRLVLRFAVSTCIALALAAAAILLVVRHYNTVQAERAATSEARVISSSVLRGSLLASDFVRAAPERRRSTLDQLFEQHVLAEGVLLVNLYAQNGTVTYSTDHRLIGTRVASTGHIREALAGTIRGDVTSLRPGAADKPRTKALRTYAPVAVPGGTGVVAIFQDYGPIARAAEATFVPVAAIFEVVLLLLFLTLVPILRRVTQRIRRQMEEIERRALYDELTGLPNRTLFGDRIEQAIAAAGQEPHTAAIMLLDVDGFREVNDALGHETGDRLLQEVAGRLGETVRSSETLARLGGDEFGILLSPGSDEDATALAARVHGVLESPFSLSGFPLEIAVSVGIAAYPEHGESVDTLLQHADVAMYVAKDGHAGTALYESEQDTNDAARLALAGELRGAIDNEELVVHFQPKAELESGLIVGVEALVRWQHPERGFIPPNEFIPIAERTGLIKPLSQYVVASALRQCGEWRKAGFDLHVAVNLTIPDLLDLELPDRIGELLAETGVRPGQLELEITETTILADPFRVRQVLNRLNEMGLRLAIDDFGTGYSSLAYLKNLPVHTIKIDRSFVMGMCEDASDATIVRSTIDLGRNLGLGVVAEGIESQEVWDALRADGCSLAQGYFISRPASAEYLKPILEERALRTRDGVAKAS